MYAVYINNSLIQGAYLHVKKDSIEVDDAIEARTTGKLTIVDVIGNQAYYQGAPVTIYDDDGNLIFGGFVSTSKARRLGPSSSQLEHDITLIDNHYIADKRIAACTYTARTCAYIVIDLITQYLAAEGISAGVIQTGATLNTAVFNYVPVSQAIDELATASNFIWYISYDKKLYFLDRNTLTAPFPITSDLIWTISSGGLTRGNSQYRNQQYIRGAKAITTLQTESQKGDGSSRTFTLSYPVAKTPTSVTVNSVAKTIGVKGVDTGKDFYWAKDDLIIAQDSSGTLLGTSDVFTIQYYGEYEIVALATSDDQIAAQLAIEGSGTGIVEQVEIAKSVTDQQTALNDALALLSEYAVQGQQFEFTIYKSGLHSGQMATVTYAPHGLNQTQMLIEQIKTSRVDNHFEYTITAVTGPALGNWSAYFKKLETIGKSFVTDITVGDTSTSLVRLKQLSETWADAEALTCTVFACPIPNAALYPSTTLYPC